MLFAALYIRPIFWIKVKDQASATQINTFTNAHSSYFVPVPPFKKNLPSREPFFSFCRFHLAVAEDFRCTSFVTWAPLDVD